MANFAIEDVKLSSKPNETCFQVSSLFWLVAVFGAKITVLPSKAPNKAGTLVHCLISIALNIRDDLRV